MGHAYAQTMFSEAAKRLQSEHGSREQYERLAERGLSHDALGPFEQQFISLRDSFYLSSVTPDGWPYVQHRGGPNGFLRVLDERTLAFADFAGNKQYITAGNLETNDKVALFFMDYPEQARLKIIGHARAIESGVDRVLKDLAKVEGYRAAVERVILISVVAFDWNCSQHITPRWTRAEFESEMAAS